MGTISLILLIVAGILVILDLVLGSGHVAAGNVRTWRVGMLLSIAVLLVIIDLLLFGVSPLLGK